MATVRGYTSAVPHLGDLQTLAYSYLRAMWRRRWIAVVVCWGLCGLGWTVVALLPNKFESSARIYVNSDTLLQPLLRGLAIDTNPVRQVEYLQRTLLSRPNLEELVHLADLDSPTKPKAEREALFRALSTEIKINQQTESLFTISYENANPVIARNVVQGMITIFSEAAAGSSRSEMNNAQHFLDEQITKYEAQLRAAEERRAAFRQKYADILPDINGGGTRLQAARTAENQAQLQLNDAVAKRDALRHELTSVPALLHVDQAAPVIVQNGTPSAVSLTSQLQQAQLRLQTLLLQDTEEHPDVIETRHQIAALKSQIAAEKEDAKKGGPSDLTQRATVSNPVYEQLKLKLADAQGAVASLQEQVRTATSERARLEALLHQVPDVELQSQNLDRDYSILKKNYEELVSRKQSTQIGEAADTQADRIQFRVVDAPQVPIKPASPNRPLLLSGVLVAAAGAGVGLAFLLTQLDRSFSSLSALRSLAIPILGSVSTFEPIEARRQRVVQIAAFSASVLVLLLIYGALMATSLLLYRVVV